MKQRGENGMGWDGDGTHKIQVEFRCLQNKAKSGSALALHTGPLGPTHLATRPSLPDPTRLTSAWHLAGRYEPGCFMGKSKRPRLRLCLAG